MRSLERMDEATLLREVAQGNEAAFRQLFEHWHPVLAAYIFRITRSKEMAAEIVQDVFLKIWLDRKALTEIRQFKPYLWVISRNHAINLLKKTMRELKRAEVWKQENSHEAVTQPENQEDIYHVLIDEAIHKLPARQQEVFILHRRENLTYQQIALKLGIGRESVKTHLKLATQTISKYLQDRRVLLILMAEIFSKKF
ncbi:sigma-70 family RNA polymerase sigma factor [Paraflavitalea sp. CAU 1676]|uniref:RNA polymerase sigma factor n=1 Tax=Paraflavitalea sp. CAU 1676 TaxID=3032598 RepID=UPI0023DAC155|nr:sigma-70 family RNA polymerase sigma factor [Paraflavitalea sp. CAU 1676]MDF2189055.1 sigma-70 family RNA polymerase sigma factor [Paraflavitalea sp. CAU 1676]